MNLQKFIYLRMQSKIIQNTSKKISLFPDVQCNSFIVFAMWISTYRNCTNTIFIIFFHVNEQYLYVNIQYPVMIEKKNNIVKYYNTIFN